MTITVTHAKVVNIADDPAASSKGEVLPSDWNANHIIGSGGVDTCIIFDKAGVFGEDTHLEWDYTDQILKISGADNPLWLGKDLNNAHYNKIVLNGVMVPNASFLGLAGGAISDPTLYFNVPAAGFYEFQVGGTNVLDYNITVNNSWNALYWQAIGGTGSFTGVFVKRLDDNNQRIFFAMDGSDNPVCGFGPGGLTEPETNLYRYGKGILGLSVTAPFNGNSGPATFQVYNSVDTPPNPTNYERGVFDWTTSSNVLTIGTQKGGTGSARNIQFVVGGTMQLDYAVSNSGAWTMPATGNGLYSPFVTCKGASGVFEGVYVRINADSQNRIIFALDGTDRATAAWGPGGSTIADTSLYRYGTAGILGLAGGTYGGNVSSPATFQVYNIIDTIGNPTPTNYERGAFDWTTTTNVLTIGTQKGGTGSTRNIQFVVGNTNVMDYGITAGGVFSVLGGGAEIDTTYFVTKGASGSEPGSYLQLNGLTFQSARFILDANNHPVLQMGNGASGNPDINLNRQGVGIFGIQNGNASTSAAGLFVYNTSDTLDAAPSANYERGVFDWTTSANVLTIGTQKGGSGSSRVVNIASTSYIEFSAAGGVLVAGSNVQPGVAIGNDWGLVLGGLQSVIAFTNNNAANAGSVDLQFSRGGAGILVIGNATNVAGTVYPVVSTFATLPASPQIGMMASISDGLAGNCGDGSCTTFGTNVTGGTGALKLNLWYNGTHWTLIGK